MHNVDDRLPHTFSQHNITALPTQPHCRTPTQTHMLLTILPTRTQHTKPQLREPPPRHPYKHLPQPATQRIAATQTTNSKQHNLGTQPKSRPIIGCKAKTKQKQTYPGSNSKAKAARHGRKTQTQIHASTCHFRNNHNPLSTSTIVISRWPTSTSFYSLLWNF